MKTRKKMIIFLKNFPTYYRFMRRSVAVSHSYAKLVFKRQYPCTLDALNFFYPRLSKHGRIISHNYNLTYGKGGNTPGVKMAFEEYFKGKECAIIEIAETQCMIIKA